MSGRLAADAAGAPYPVVVLVSGVNCPADAYRWLAFRLVEAGFVVVGYDWVGQLFPGEYGLTPGVDIVAAGPDHYGERPTTPALGPVLEAVAALNESGQLAGLLDLDKVGRLRPLGRRHRAAAVGAARVVPAGPRGRRVRRATRWPRR